MIVEVEYHNKIGIDLELLTDTLLDVCGRTAVSLGGKYF